MNDRKMKLHTDNGVKTFMTDADTWGELCSHLVNMDGLGAWNIAYLRGEKDILRDIDELPEEDFEISLGLMKFKPREEDNEE